MLTVFDYLTVACFGGLVLAFLILTRRQPQVLLRLMISGVAFAVANQLGNRGSVALAVLVVVAGVCYSIVVIRGEPSP